jgi:GH15 family glucan-1,4-alpha-glucosidase
VRLEDYALIGDTHTAALVGRDGSIDWMCVPRFDSDACFAALVGDRDHGRWQLAPRDKMTGATRRYRPATLVLETDMTTATGAVRIVDCMPVRDQVANVVRIVQGLAGHVEMCMDLTIRFGYGLSVPWVRQVDGALRAIAGPDALTLYTKVPTSRKGLHTVAEFAVDPGEQVCFTLVHHPSHLDPPAALDPFSAVAATEQWWQGWCERADCGDDPRWRDVIQRSLIVLKALTYAPTGGIVAAPTTSLPEQLGGVRNWDYRFCWVRDATFTLYALLAAGFLDEARAWRHWLLRAVAGDPSALQTVYGVAGERRLPEIVLTHLPGYEASAPVRIGNAAATQFQLDVYGEMLDAMHQARKAGLAAEDAAWALEAALIAFVEGAWQRPDEGIWEMRGDRRHFTHSKVMAWVALDRAVRAVEQFGLRGPVERWRATRDAIHADVCAHGWHAGRGTFVQYYGASEVDAALLMMPLVGFLPADDPRVAATVAAIERDLVTREGYVLRYRTEHAADVDGLPPGEGSFLPCTIWLADVYALQGRTDEARGILERVLAIGNDLGLFAEEYDPRLGRMLGNFPQAFTHVSLVNAARALAPGATAPVHERAREGHGEAR